MVKLDADDLLAPGALARATALLDAHPEISFVYGRPQHFSGPRPRRVDVAHEELDGVVGARVGRSALPHGRQRHQPARGRHAHRVPAPRAPDPRELPHTSDLHLWMQLAALGDVGRVNGPAQGYYREHEDSMQRTVNAGRFFDLSPAAMRSTPSSPARPPRSRAPRAARPRAADARGQRRSTAPVAHTTAAARGRRRSRASSPSRSRPGRRPASSRNGQRSSAAGHWDRNEPGATRASPSRRSCAAPSRSPAGCAGSRPARWARNAGSTWERDEPAPPPRAASAPAHGDRGRALLQLRALPPAGAGDGARPAGSGRRGDRDRRRFPRRVGGRGARARGRRRPHPRDPARAQPRPHRDLQRGPRAGDGRLRRVDVGRRRADAGCAGARNRAAAGRAVGGLRLRLPDGVRRRAAARADEGPQLVRLVRHGVDRAPLSQRRELHHVPRGRDAHVGAARDRRLRRGAARTPATSRCGCARRRLPTSAG